MSRFELIAAECASHDVTRMAQLLGVSTSDDYKHLHTHAADEMTRRSMGATGICWDNAGVESLWSSFKHEHYYWHVFGTKAELFAAVDNWMNFYNMSVCIQRSGCANPSTTSTR